MKKYIIIILVMFILSGCNRPELILEKKQNENVNINTPIEVEPKNSPEESSLVKPIAEFDSRINKKPFGLYITPQTSPVQPEKFSGYHTGVDVEYDDINDEVLVMSIAAGQIVRSGWVSGYGGMVAIKHNIEGKDYIVIYGHLKADNSLIKNNSYVKMGQKIGILGQGYSYDTDGERKHLHFAIYTGEDTNVRGYAESQKELEKWLDPVKFFR